MVVVGGLGKGSYPAEKRYALMPKTQQDCGKNIRAFQAEGIISAKTLGAGTSQGTDS